MASEQYPANQQGSSTNPEGNPSPPERKQTLYEVTSCNVKEEKITDDIVLEELKPRPLRALPPIPGKSEDDNSGFNTEIRFQINWNPLGLGRKTICCLIISATAIGFVIGMTITIFALRTRKNGGKLSCPLFYFYVAT